MGDNGAIALLRTLEENTILESVGIEKMQMSQQMKSRIIAKL